MTVFDSYKEMLDFSRSRVHAMLDDIEQMDKPTDSILSWRPGDGRAHIGWQIMHVAVTEEMFGTQRLADRATDALHANIWEAGRKCGVTAAAAAALASCTERLLRCFPKILSVSSV